MDNTSRLIELYRRQSVLAVRHDQLASAYNESDNETRFARSQGDIDMERMALNRRARVSALFDRNHRRLSLVNRELA